ncbi:MAG: SDR family NAD(P)-dependent oxidoreductase [Aggregatilineales bacterium]
MDIASLYASIRPRYPELSGKVAIVTGSGRGIGKGILLRLAREGMKVVIHSLDANELSQSVDELRNLGATVLGVRADFRQDAEIEGLIKQTVDAFGTLDLLVNNAADVKREHLFNVSMELLDNQLAVNIRAPYLCAWRAAEVMSRARQGSIINISSVGGIRAHWAGLPYDVSKGAIDAMTRAMSLDLARKGVRVNAIAPGAIFTERRNIQLDDPQMQAIAERIPMARFGLPVEIGSAVAFLASDDAAYITGQVLYVDGGITAQLSPPGQPI